MHIARGTSLNWGVSNTAALRNPIGGLRRSCETPARSRTRLSGNPIGQGTRGVSPAASPDRSDAMSSDPLFLDGKCTGNGYSAVDRPGASTWTSSRLALCKPSWRRVAESTADLFRG